MPSFRVTVAAALAALMIPPAAAHAQTPSSSEKPIGILLAAGDIAECVHESRRVNGQATGALIQQQIQAAQTRGIPVAVLALGDLAYPRGSAEDFRCFHDVWSQHFAKLILPVPGNHEYSHHSLAEAYFAHFKAYGSKFIASNTTGYYSLVFPEGHPDGWLLLGLNSQMEQKQHWWQQSEQIDWLRGELANPAHAARRCVLGFWHHFVFSSGLHGHRDSFDSNARVRGGSMQSAFKLLYEHGATAVVTAHDHDFEQFGRQDVRGVPRQDGLRSFIVGTGGGGLYNTAINRITGETRPLVYARQAANSERYENNSNGILRIELFADRYQWAFVPIPGNDPIDLEGMDSDTCNRFRP